MLPTLISLLATFTAHSAEPNAAPANAGSETGNRDTAWGIVMGGASSKSTAETMLRDYQKRDLPRLDGRPRVMSASSLGIEGDHGWVVLIAATTHRPVADALYETMKSSGLLITIEQIKAGKADDLRLLLVDHIDAIGNGAPLHVYDYCLRPIGKACVGHGRTDENGRVIVPFLGIKGDPALELVLDAGEPWSCAPIALGPWRGTDARWLRGPTETTCSVVDVARKREKI